jgi:hypothetical protein
MKKYNLAKFGVLYHRFLLKESFENKKAKGLTIEVENW